MASSSLPLQQAIEIFFSYASADEELCIELTKHLRSLERARVISGWHKRLIKAGTERDNAIHSHLETSQIILLLWLDPINEIEIS